MGGKDKALHRELRFESLDFRDARPSIPSIPSSSSTPRKILTSLNSQLSPLTKRAFQQSLLELGWHCADLPPLLQLVPN